MKKGCVVVLFSFLFFVSLYSHEITRRPSSNGNGSQRPSSNDNRPSINEDSEDSAISERESVPIDQEESISLNDIYDIGSKKEFYRLVEKSDNLIAFFYTTWSGPCFPINFILKMIRGNFPKIIFVKINADTLRHLAVSRGVKRLPTLIFYSSTKEIHRISEIVPPCQLEELIERLYYKQKI